MFALSRSAKLSCLVRGLNILRSHKNSCLNMISYRAPVSRTMSAKARAQHTQIENADYDSQNLPTPGTLKNCLDMLKNLNVLLITNAENNMVKRVRLELEKNSVSTRMLETTDGSVMEETVAAVTPDVIVCPFLTAKIPESIYNRKDIPCLIVHPGIAGDRGPSSIDWAIHEGRKEWGVTVLQADSEMDAGDIWCTSTFPVNDQVTKTSMYNGPLADAAVDAVLESLVRYRLGIPPQPLDYNQPEIKGTLKPSMKHEDRNIDWSKSSDHVLKTVRMSDTRPGAIASLKTNTPHGYEEKQFRLFGGHLESKRISDLNRLMSRTDLYAQGEIVGHCYGHILIATGENELLWIAQLKNIGKKQLKLPATHALPQEWMETIPNLEEWNWDFKDLWVEKKNDVAYVHFDFYNGAMDKTQCARLESVLLKLADMKDIRTVALMGGERFFSTGIHLNVIEASSDPAEESWQNINKIDDVIKAMVSLNNKLVVAALQGNAGAGGAMMAAAADIVIAHPGVVLSPSYNAMNIFGSEYWTYFFPRRVGESTAKSLTESGESISAEQASSIGLVDYVLGRNKEEFKKDVPQFIHTISQCKMTENMITKKMSLRDQDWFDVIQRHRDFELEKMKTNFESESYHEARKNFVYH